MESLRMKWYATVYLVSGLGFGKDLADAITTGLPKVHEED